MKRYRVDKVVCNYETDHNGVVAIIRVYRVDRFGCYDFNNEYRLHSAEQLNRLSTVVNFRCDEVAAMPFGWIGFVV